MKERDYINLWPKALENLKAGNWRQALILWAEAIVRMIEDNTYIPKYAKYTRQIVKVARSDGKEEERVARTACQDILVGAVTTLINIGRGHKRYPKLTLYYSCEHERKLFYIKGDFREWIIQWLYWAIAGRLMTPGGLLRLFFSFGCGAAILFSFFYVGGLEWTDSTRRDAIEWYHYFYFSGLTLTTLGYGDLHPIPSDMLRCFISIFEAIIGYLLLGLMVVGFVQFNTPPHWPHKIDLAGKIAVLRRKWDMVSNQSLHTKMFFDTTVDLFEAYRKKLNSESPPSYNKAQALEVRKRLRQLSFICDKVREYEQTVIKSIPDVFGVDVEKFASNKPNAFQSSQLFKPKQFQTYRTAWFEMEFFVESFYYLADRIRKVLRHKTKNTFLGLKSFDAKGVCEVRNHLLAHPEDFGQISVPSLDCGGTKGPRLKTAKSVGDRSAIVDRGFWVNATEFKDNLEILLRKKLGE